MSKVEAFRRMKLGEDYDRLRNTSLGSPREMDALVAMDGLQNSEQLIRKLIEGALAGKKISAVAVREKRTRPGHPVLPWEKLVEEALEYNPPPERGEPSGPAETQECEAQQPQPAKSDSALLSARRPIIGLLQRRSLASAEELLGPKRADCLELLRLLREKYPDTGGVPCERNKKGVLVRLKAPAVLRAVEQMPGGKVFGPRTYWRVRKAQKGSQRTVPADPSIVPGHTGDPPK